MTGWLLSGRGWVPVAEAVRIVNYPGQPRDPDGEFAGGSGGGSGHGGGSGADPGGEFGLGVDPHGVSYDEHDVDPHTGAPKFSQSYRDEYGSLKSDTGALGTSGLAVAVGTKRGIHVADDSQGALNRQVVQDFTAKQARAVGEGIYEVYNGDRESFTGSGVSVRPAGPNPTRDGVHITWANGRQTVHEGEAGDNEAFDLQEALDLSSHGRPTNRVGRQRATRPPMTREGQTMTGYEVVNRAGPGPMRMYLYGGVDTGVTANQILADLKHAAGRDVELHINSGGGAYHEGLSIYNALRAYRGQVTAVVDGAAGSAASIVAMGADRVLMTRGSSIFIHDVGIHDLSGGADEVARHALILTGWSNDVAAIYATRAGGTAEEWRQRMIRQTTFTAAEAVEFGLADGIVDSRELVTASAARRLVYSPENRRRTPGLVSPWTTPTRRLVNDFMAAPATARRSMDDLTAQWVGFCIASSLVACLSPYPVGRQMLANAAARI